LENFTDTNDLAGTRRVEKTGSNCLPNEVFFNIFEKIQDDKALLFSCLNVQKRWYHLALPHLWHHFEFSISSKQNIRKLNQLVTDEHLAMHLSGEIDHSLINPNFTLVRSLFLSINICGARVNDRHESELLSVSIKKFIILLTSCTDVRYLGLDIRPFCPINASIAAWRALEGANGSLLELIQCAAAREYTTLYLDVSIQKWQYDAKTSDQIQRYLRCLARHTTRLHLVDRASSSWSSIAPLLRLRRLEFENVGSPSIEACAAFWDVVESLSLEELALTGFSFPHDRTFPKWQQTLKSLRFNHFSETEETVSKILTSFPNLRTLAFHNPLSSTIDNSAVANTQIACVNLRKIVFTHCRAQRNLLSQIAKACPQLQICMPPDNASDLDIVTLIDYCPNLTALLIDSCTELTSISIHHIPRAERLRSLLFNIHHLFSLDEECTPQLARIVLITQSRTRNYGDGSER
jgi:hypothetical protein